jgi:aspartate/tyrosine/aromatic aminotransferase
LLEYAIEKDSIDLACKHYQELMNNEKINIEIGSIRKRLERLLKNKLDKYIKNNISNPAISSKYFPYTGTDTVNMLELYCEIMLMEMENNSNDEDEH